MYLLRVVSLFTFLAGVLSQQIPITHTDLDVQDTVLDSQQQDAAVSLRVSSEQPIENPEDVLDALTARIQIETSIIDVILDRYQDPLNDRQQKILSAVIGLNFNRITQLLQEADEMLKDMQKKDPDGILMSAYDDEEESTEGAVPRDDGKCGKMCMSKKANNIVKMIGHSVLNAILKVGLNLLGKYVNPAFLALSGFVLGVNTIAGGSLVVVSVLVNGIFLAIAGGIAYLGHLVSEKERQKMGGPGGPKTKEIAQMLELLGRAVA